MTGAGALRRIIHNARFESQAIGVTQAIGYRAKVFALRGLQSLGIRARGHQIRLRARGIHTPLYTRFGTSDEQVFRQVFIYQLYYRLDSLQDISLVVDCGANVGHSTVYFLERFPMATVIAVEPAPENVLLCQRNIEPFGTRARVVPAGIWPRSADLTVYRGETGELEPWALEVREAAAGNQGAVKGITLGQVLAESGFDRIDILKVDIEGAEDVVFGEGAQSWLPCVRNIAIEIHGEACRSRVFEALAPYEFKLETKGEVTYFLDLRRKPVVGGGETESSYGYRRR